MTTANPIIRQGPRISHVPHAAATAARRLVTTARPATLSIAKSSAWIVLTATMMSGLAALFGALVGSSLH